MAMTNSGPEKTDEEEICIVCFESLVDIGSAVTLPCACSLTYCFQCWAHSLAASWGVTRCARCPSCRGAMRVDFDAEKECLTFTTSEGGTDTGMVDRLTAQARPFQRRLLDQYRATAAEVYTEVSVIATGRVGEIMIHDAADDELSYKLCFHDGQSHPDWFAAAAVERGPVTRQTWKEDAPPPSCVCGSTFKHKSCRERVEECIVLSVDRNNAIFLQIVDRAMKRPPVRCDVCDQSLPATSGVWTCQNGTSTILHPWNLDVCDSCMQPDKPPQ